MASRNWFWLVFRIRVFLCAMASMTPHLLAGPSISSRPVPATVHMETRATVRERGPQSKAGAAPASSDAELAAARRLLQQGKYDEALAALHDLEAKHPGVPQLAHELGTAYYKKGNYMNAIAYFKKAQAENPGDNEAV